MKKYYAAVLFMALFTAYMFSRVSGSIASEIGYFAVPTIIGCAMLWRKVNPIVSIVIFVIIGGWLGFTEMKRYAQDSNKDLLTGCRGSPNLFGATAEKIDAYCGCIVENAGLDIFKTVTIKLVTFREPRIEDSDEVVMAAHKVCERKLR